MTIPDFERMTDAELAAEAARLMWGKPVARFAAFTRWKPPGGDYRVVRKSGYEGRIGQAFDPANDLRHAAEFGAAFLASHADTWMRIDTSPEKTGVQIFTNEIFRDNSADTLAAAEARARTIATLKAWTALGGGA